MSTISVQFMLLGISLSGHQLRHLADLKAKRYLMIGMCYGTLRPSDELSTVCILATRKFIFRDPGISVQWLREQPE
jgi:hypothetical protein